MSKSETNRQHLSNQPRLLTAVLEHQLPITIFHIFDKSDSLITKLITNVLTNHFFFLISREALLMSRNQQQRLTISDSLKILKTGTLFKKSELTVLLLFL